MSHNQEIAIKRARNIEAPFPWRCRQCGKTEVVMAMTEYKAEVRHDGRLYTFTIPNLEIPVCGACGARVFTGAVDAQVNDALQNHLKLLTPFTDITAVPINPNPATENDCFNMGEFT